MLLRAIPNLFTLLNLFCGFLSLGFAAKGDYKDAAILIIIGMMLDSMDGRLARIFKASTEMGKELDSLADIVTFGVAPAMLIYYISFEKFGFVGLLIAGIFPLFGAYRLARFNINASKSSLSHFTGVPITAAGGILTLIVLLHNWVSDIVIIVSFTALCFLMVSKLKIPSFKEIPIPKYGTIITLLIGVAIYVVFMTRHNQFPYFIYIAVPMYVAFVGYRWKKGNKLKKERMNIENTRENQNQ